VAVTERKRRNKMLRILSEKKQNMFYRMNEGRVAKVLWEHESRNGMMEGYSENYIRVKAEYDPDFVNKITQLTLENFKDGVYSVASSREIQQD